MASTGRPAEHADVPTDRAQRGPQRSFAPRWRRASGGLSAPRLVRFLVFVWASGAVLALTAAGPVSAEPSAEELKRGEDLLITYCGSCHATGRTGASRRPDAPAFRTLGRRYPIDSLEESLGEGIMSGHPDMPELSFDGDDVGAIVDYLKSIQVR